MCKPLGDQRVSRAWDSKLLQQLSWPPKQYADCRLRGSAYLGGAHLHIWWSSHCLDWTIGVTGLCPCVLSSNRLSWTCFHGNCKIASRDRPSAFFQGYACVRSAKIPSAKESHMAGLGSGQEGTARWHGWKKKNRALMQSLSTACPCNRGTSQFMVKLIQATSLHTANI